MSEAFDRSPAPARAIADALIDYAGLFPPAKLPMAEAVQHYAKYFVGPHKRILGRFVVPVSRLEELENGLAAASGANSALWQLSILGSANPVADAAAIGAFNTRHPFARIVGIEIKPNAPSEIQAWASLPASVEVWLEAPATGPLAPFLDSVAKAGRGAKLRTGGITSDAFPSPGRIVEFLAICDRLNVSAKMTAGLHHPLAGSFPLTYEPGSAAAPMYGFLNVILAAALVQSGAPEARVSQALTDGDASNFRCRTDTVEWRDVIFTIPQLDRVRRTLVRSFGSCSFTEPIEGLQSLGWL